MSADNLPRPSTPGPWGWFGYRSGPIYLATQHGGRVYVMDFVRHGMRGAQPRFQRDCLMEKASDLAVQEVEYRDDIVDIDHPDARAFAALPEWIDAHDAAVAERDALQRRMDAVRAHLDQVPREPHHPSRRALYMERCEMAREIRALLDGEGVS